MNLFHSNIIYIINFMFKIIKIVQIGYGFCEYQDTETALSAMRNLNGRELHGRNLRVDHATRDHGVDPKVRNHLKGFFSNFTILLEKTYARWHAGKTRTISRHSSFYAI